MTKIYSVLFSVWFLQMTVTFWAKDCSAEEIDIRVRVPQTIQRHMCERAQKAFVASFPDVDQTWLTNELARTCLKDDYVVKVSKSSCEFAGTLRTEKKVAFRMGFEQNGNISLRVEENLPSQRETFTQKITDKESAKVRAQGIYDRVHELLVAGVQMGAVDCEGKPTTFGGLDNVQRWRFEWIGSDDRGGEFRITVFVRQSDGLPVWVILLPSWSNALGKPIISRHQALDLAKKGPGNFHQGNFREDCLAISYWPWFADKWLTWEYMPPPTPTVGPVGYAVWDAMTGDVIKSDCTSGGKRDAPYFNPVYNYEPTEANIKAHLEKNIKKWAEELEAKQQKEKAASSTKSTESQTHK